MFSNNSVNRALKKIKIALDESLVDNYYECEDEILNEILKVHGLHIDNFNLISNIENLISNPKINDISIDDNSNKNEKTVEAIHQEVFNPIKKIIGFRYLYRKLKEIYGVHEAKRLTSKIYDYSLVLNDSTNILKVYCYSFDFSKLVLEGRQFGQLKSKPCKRISSYTSALCETIHQLSSHVAGAVTPATYFLDLAHLLIFKEDVELKDIKENKNVRKYIENEMQQLVHSVNHLSRNSNESPFSNVSLFDRIKLASLLNEDNFAWYFSKESFITDDTNKLLNMNNEDYKKYIIEIIIELQKIFINFFDKGDPLAGGAPYRFPICTINFGKILEDNKFIIKDLEFLGFLTKSDIFRFNIFCSEGTKVASCCRLLSNEELLSIGSQSNSFSAGSSVSIGSHRVLTINLNRIALESDSIQNFYDILDTRLYDSAKILKAHKELINDLKDLQLFLQIGWINLNRLFSTYGLLGYYECIETLEKKFKIDKEKELERILEVINKKAKKLSKEFEIAINIETIPGESQAVKMCKVDKLLFGEKNVPYTLYSNQFIPLWKEATIWKRLKIDGKYNQLISGGGIVHAQINDQVTQKQAMRIIKYAIECGCEHFALNSIYSKCKNEHTTFGKSEKCPLCNENIMLYFTRVVGFFTPVQYWNPIRREWEFPKRTFINTKEEE